MNELVQRVQKDDFPVIFRYMDMLSLYANQKDLNRLLDEAIKSNYIDNVYNDIYALSRNYRKSFISGCVLAQMINPDSYISTRYVLFLEDWINETIFVITSITNKESMFVTTNEDKQFSYKNLYSSLNMAGIKIEKDSNGEYRIAKPLRALCDLLYQKKLLGVDIDYLTNNLRISFSDLEILTSEDFDELEENMKIKEMVMFLQRLRRELSI